jgi:predicted acylesterase/phospholipase RssA
VSLSLAQSEALQQLRAIERLDPGGVEIIGVREPNDDTDSLLVQISLDCRGVEHRTSGVRLRDRERFDVLIDPAYPFGPPSVLVRHLRWAGTPHVQFGVSVCLYASEAVEWQPSDGMLGFVERLWQWLNSAAAGELDPDDAPMHPPVAYVSSLDEVPMVIPRADTPAFGDEPWIGGVELEKHSSTRIDLVAWRPEITSWLDGAAPAILLPGTLDFEYPRTVGALLRALAERGVPRDRVFAILKLAALGLKEDEPLIFVLGTAMRGTATDRRQHLAVWYLEPIIAWGLGHSLQTAAEDPDVRASAERVEQIIADWAEDAKMHWCPVREDRPEVTRRRDTDSPLREFAGRSIAVWGCGALGAPVAEWLARAGAAKLILYDKASVAPGVLVRQPFIDAAIGQSKAYVLAGRLRAIRPRDLEVVVRTRNVLRSALAQEDWHDGADVVIDATASHGVASKLELMRRRFPQDAAIVSMIVGHTAEHALLTLAPPGYSGAGLDVARQVKLACARRGEFHGFLSEFWPKEARAKPFQPEPGCSDPTFTGSGAEVSALAASMLVCAARELRNGDRPYAVAHLITLALDHEGPREARLSFAPAQRVPGGKDGEIRLARSAYSSMEGWIARGARMLGPTSETGGVVFGERDAACGVTWVDEVIGPPPDSRCSPEEFVCGTQGVTDYCEEKHRRGRGSLEYLGMWHTHPTQAPIFSATDLIGMPDLLDASSSPLAQSLLLIVGHVVPGPPALGAFVFERSELERSDVSDVWLAAPTELKPEPAPPAAIGLALSGGGSRALAFHLGCLRALYDRGILQRTSVISSVSGGSLISALWAYGDEDFESFDARVCALLRSGLQTKIARHALLSARAPQELATLALAGTASSAARVRWLIRRLTGGHGASAPPLRRWVSRTDAFADVLDREICGGRLIGGTRRPGLDVVINACELRTGSAFRFGSRESGCWRVGRIPENVISLATAVAASAAYPLMLPALDKEWTLEKRDGTHRSERLLLTDGGVFDNLGTSCLEPGRSSEFSYNVFPVDYIIACDAGRGLLDPVTPYGWLPRVQRSFETTFRKLQDGGRGRLHDLRASGHLRGFIMPYLGQQDHALPAAPADLIPREEVVDYPTDFRAMNTDTLTMLATRGEQLTIALLDAHLPEL